MIIVFLAQNTNSETFFISISSFLAMFVRIKYLLNTRYRGGGGGGGGFEAMTFYDTRLAICCPHSKG